MKIGVCLRTWGEKGGIGVYSRNLTEALLALDTKNQYVLFYHTKTALGRFHQYEHVKEVHVSAPGKFLWDQQAVPAYAKKEKVDTIFHTKFAVPLLTKCKTVMVLHGSERFVYPQFSHKSDILFFKTVYPFYLRGATAIISVSENARNDIIHFLKIDPAKIRTIHLAPSKVFRKIDDQSILASVRNKYRLPDRFILNVGRIYPGKNIPNLLRAFSLIREKEDIKLVISGFGYRMYKNDLNMIHKLRLENDVFLPGYIPHEDLVAVYNLAEMVVFPSFYESFPAIPLESMACGCPIVISRTGGSPEAAGDAARYVDPWDVEDIAHGINDLLTNPQLRQELVQRGFAHAQRFSWEKCAQETLTLLESI
jgi:glycosyltransferase involved in cell wall biosynthesis